MNLHDGPSGIAWYTSFSTAFPTTLTLSASWDRSLAYAYGGAVAQELYIKGIQGFLAPMVDLTRAPLGGEACLLLFFFCQVLITKVCHLSFIVQQTGLPIFIFAWPYKAHEIKFTTSFILIFF